MQGQQQGQPGQYQPYIQHQQQYQPMQQQPPPQMNYQMQHHQHQRQKIDKPIKGIGIYYWIRFLSFKIFLKPFKKATEIKSYLHAWCTKRGEKPEYTYEANGKPPKVVNHQLCYTHTQIIEIQFSLKKDSTIMIATIE